MPISATRCRQHIDLNSGIAGQSFWPKYLFHHAHVTAAAKALSDGRLICRNDQDVLVHDVASQEAIAVNPRAGDFVRLYFRPLNNFHLSTEGIKFRSDGYRRENHMSIPIILMLDAEEVLALPGVGFSCRKLAHIGEEAHFNEQGFDSIAFNDVYHQGPPGVRMREIQDRRMAEVIVPRVLSLQSCLKHIVCRTIYDERTIRHFASESADGLLSKIRVPNRVTDFFFCRDTFIHRLEISAGHIHLKLFQGRNYNSGQSVHCIVRQMKDGRTVRHADFEQAINNDGVRIGPFADPENSTWRIEIEDVLAFEGTLPFQTSTLVTTPPPR